MSLLYSLTIILFLNTPHAYPQNADFSYIDIEYAIKDLKANQKDSRFYKEYDITPLLILDERIRNIVKEFDPGNVVFIAYPKGYKITPDRIQHLNIKLDSIQEIFEDYVTHKKIKRKINNIPKGSRAYLGDKVYIKGSNQAVFSFIIDEENIRTYYKAEIIGKMLSITVLYMNPKNGQLPTNG